MFIQAAVRKIVPAVLYTQINGFLEIFSSRFIFLALDPLLPLSVASDQADSVI